MWGSKGMENFHDDRETGLLGSSFDVGVVDLGRDWGVLLED